MERLFENFRRLEVYKGDHRGQTLCAGFCEKSVTSVGRVFFKPLSNLLSSTGRRPPVKPVVLAKRVAEGVDGDDEHAQLDEVLQPQPQLGAAGQAAGAAALLGKPPGNFKGFVI